ncbi:hypothetical protein HNQ51_002182 [Inhella inkyongensis]|uniref:Uncharacterized protein n=1 Tax=Inhella inkyongensis TaxID=392593 RepID=A0A840S5U0_9BURK|nr:hypothetical protein [Inhella inkyongensis]MBB5204868.1 hypothetical protein [Inhella inkyongensis]
MPHQDLERTAKSIADLDALVSGLLASVPARKPGQRQLLADCAAADRSLQVLRMAISMNRPMHEMTQAAHELLGALRLANAHIATARADLATRQAVQLCVCLALQVGAQFTVAAPA